MTTSGWEMRLRERKDYCRNIGKTEAIGIFILLTSDISTTIIRWTDKRKKWKEKRKVLGVQH